MLTRYRRQATGYYYSAASGYYYDATSKLYYHPSTNLWYETDVVTGLLKEHVSEEEQAAIDAANAAAIAAQTAAADAARAAVTDEGDNAVATKPVEAAPLDEKHGKVILGLGKGKKGMRKVAMTSSVFAKAVQEEREAEFAAQEAVAKLHAEEEVLVDWAALICRVCRRKFKDSATLRKHIESSALHAASLQFRASKQQADTDAVDMNAAAPPGGSNDDFGDRPHGGGGSSVGSGGVPLRHWPERKEMRTFLRASPPPCVHPLSSCSHNPCTSCPAQPAPVARAPPSRRAL